MVKSNIVIQMCELLFQTNPVDGENLHNINTGLAFSTSGTEAGTQT